MEDLIFCGGLGAPTQAKTFLEVTYCIAIGKHQDSLRSGKIVITRIVV